MEVPVAVSIGNLTDRQVADLAPWVVVTAIHNLDAANGDIAWYGTCQSADAQSRLWSRDWQGGPYAACVYPCESFEQAQRVREELIRRDHRAAERRYEREAA